MNSVFSLLYLALQDRIKKTVPEIEWIEQDFGQEAFDKWRPNVAFPAVLIDFSNTDYQSMSELSQFGTISINLRLLVAPFSQSYEGAPIEVVEDALNYFEIEHKLISSLQGWAPENELCQPLIRERITSVNNNNIGLRIREISFSTGYQEYFGIDPDL